MGGFASLENPEFLALIRITNFLAWKGTEQSASGRGSAQRDGLLRFDDVQAL